MLERVKKLHLNHISLKKIFFCLDDRFFLEYSLNILNMNDVNMNLLFYALFLINIYDHISLVGQIPICQVSLNN